MSVGANASAIGWYPQAKKGTAVPAGTKYYWHKAQSFMASPVELFQMFPQEIGSSYLPSDGYKAGYWVQGDMNLLPRTKSALGWLLMGYAGKCSSAQISTTGAYRHTMPGEADTAMPHRYMSFRRLVPGVDADGLPTFHGETFEDCTITSMVLGATPGGILGMRLGFIGLKSTYTPDIEDLEGSDLYGWDPDNDQSGGYETGDGVPLTTRGSFTFADGNTFTLAQAAQISFGWATPDPRQEMVLFSYTPHDTTQQVRAISIQATVFWQNPTLYRAMTYNAGNAWSPVIYRGTSDTTLVFNTPDDLYGSPKQAGEIGFTFKKGVWRIDPIGLEGGGQIICTMTGTVIDYNSAGNDWGVTLVNEKTSYAWPAADSTAPTFTAAVTASPNRNTVVLTFSEDVFSTNFAAGWTVKFNDVASAVLGAQKVDATHVRLFVDTAGVASDTIKISYDPATGSVVDGSGNEVATTTDQDCGTVA